MKVAKRRSLGPFVLAMLCLAVVISLRNLPLTAEYGYASVFFYAVAALFFMIPYGLVSAELASGWPKGGGVFIWVKEALGERWGFFAIFMQWAHNLTWYPVMLAFIATGVAYLIDPSLAKNKTYLLSAILIGFWGITLLNFLGIKTSAWMSTICVIIGAIIPGIVLIAVGFKYVLSGNPLAIQFTPSSLLPDLSHFSNLVFMAGIFLALSGLEATANLARDVKNPKKNYPKAILIATVLTLIILILGSLAIAIVIPHENISLVAGLLDAFVTFFTINNILWLFPVMVIFTIAGALGELNAWTIAGAEGLFITTEYGLLPPFLHKLNKKFIPTRLLIFQGILVTVAAFAFLYLPNINLSYWVLSVLSAFMYLLVYIFLFIAGVVLRYRKPDVERPYKVPFGNVGIWICALVGIVACLFALFVGFFPPTTFHVASVLQYELILSIGLAVVVALPLVLYALRKPSWKREVLSSIRHEIHQSLR